jgi:hypothetical protein
VDHGWELFTGPHKADYFIIGWIPSAESFVCCRRVAAWHLDLMGKFLFFKAINHILRVTFYGKEEMSQLLWTFFTIVDIFDSLSCCYKSVGTLRVDA